MGVELIVLGRHPLPPSERRFGLFPVRLELQLRCAEGGADVEEAALGEARTLARTLRLDFEPRCHVRIRKAWERAEAAAEALALCVGGVVTDDGTGEVSFDAGSACPLPGTRAEVVARVRDAFANPEPFYARWAREERARFSADE